MIESEALIATYPLAAAVTALLAGLASSASPCTVAAMPLVVGYVGGYADGRHRRAFFFSAAFVLGLSLTFTGVGLAIALASAHFLSMGVLWKYVLIIFTLMAGVSLLAGLKFPSMNKVQCGVENNQKYWIGASGAFLTGSLSGFVFAPCATPVMIGILALIGNQQNVLFGTFLMFLYSLGHGALLLAAGSSIGFAQWFVRSRWAESVNWLFNRLAGVLLIGYGIYLVAELTNV